MQILGILTALSVVYIGFMERTSEMGSFDPIALLIIVIGMIGATMLGSRPRHFFSTIRSAIEVLPLRKNYDKGSDSIENERKMIEDLWLQGKKVEASNIAEQSSHEAIKLMVEHIMSRSEDSFLDNRFTALGHKCVDRWEPAIGNWELMAKLGPAFGMVGTLTGMIQLFKDFGGANTNLGASLSLALLSTLYGLVLGCGVAGPIGNFLSNLMHQRIQVLKRCHKTAKQLIGIG